MDEITINKKDPGVSSSGSISEGAALSQVSEAKSTAAVWDKVIRGTIYTLTFLLPILFTPWTFEPLEFSKQMLLFILVSAGIIAWLLKMLVTRTWRFIKTPLDLPIGIFLVVYLLASLFSIDRVASFLGSYGSFSGNFFQVLFLALFYYLVVNNFQALGQLKKLLAVFLVSGTITLIFTLLQFFGAFVVRLPFAKVTSFNPVGSLLAITLVAAFMVILSMGVKSKSWVAPGIGRAWRIAAMVISFVILLAINFVYAWVALLVGLLLYMIFQIAFSANFSMKNFVAPLVMLILVISFLVIQLVFPFVSIRSIFSFNLPVEVRLDYTTAAPVLKGVVTSRPILGTGPGTFLYAFSEHRDEKFNLSPFWNVRFDKAPSEAAELLVASGVLGFLAFEIMSIIFALYGLFFLMRKREDPSWNFALTCFAGFAVLWVAHFFFFFTTVIAFVYWLLIGAFMAVTRVATKEQVKSFNFSLATSPRQTVSALSVISLALVVIIVFMFFATSVYASDIFFRRGIIQSSSRDLNAAQSNFERAIRLNRFRPDYYLTYSEFLFLRINEELATKDPNLTNIQSWLASSINTSRAAVNLSPANWTAWERLANLYTSARPLVAGVDKFIIESLTKATENDAKNPILFAELGQVYRLAARSIDPAILGKGVDTDQDGLSDEQEQALSSDVQNPDSNGNNVLDGNEVLAGLSPTGTGALPDQFLTKYIKVNQENLLKAEEAFRKAISLKEDYATAYYQLALTLEQSGKTEAAIAEMEQALQKFPREVVLKFDLGRMYFNTGKVDLAARQFQEILTIQPTNANVRFSLALSYERLGNTARALVEYKKVLETNPDNETLKAKIVQLESASTSPAR